MVADVTLMIVGDSASGKSCLMDCFIRDRFQPNRCVTLGPEPRHFNLWIDEAKIRLKIWDTNGLHRPSSRSIRAIYYREVAGVIITYRVGMNETFHSVPYWIEEAKQFGPPGVKLIIVGTGCDRKDREVDYFTARDFADEQQLSFFEVSAKDGTNVELAFLTLVQEIRQSQ